MGIVNFGRLYYVPDGQIAQDTYVKRSHLEAAYAFNPLAFEGQCLRESDHWNAYINHALVSEKSVKKK